MRKERSLVWAVTALLVVAAMVLASCAPQATEAPPATEPAAPGTEAPAATGEPVVITGENYSPDIPEPSEPVTVSWATWVNTESPLLASDHRSFPGGSSEYHHRDSICPQRGNVR
jgi:hypothetical protein